MNMGAIGDAAVGTVLGGLALAALLALLGWLWARSRRAIGRRPHWVLRMGTNDRWILERTRRRTAFEVKLSLMNADWSEQHPIEDNIDGPDAEAWSQRSLRRSLEYLPHGTQGPEWERLLISWIDGERRTALVIRRDGVERYRIHPERGRPLKWWERFFLAE